MFIITTIIIIIITSSKTIAIWLVYNHAASERQRVRLGPDVISYQAIFGTICLPDGACGISYLHGTMPAIVSGIPPVTPARCRPTSQGSVRTPTTLRLA